MDASWQGRQLMKFLDQIAELETRTKSLLDASDKLSNVMGDAARQLAEVQQALANAPKAWGIDVKVNGQEFTICERDGLVLFAALTRCLEGEEVAVKLASGQTPKLRLTDLEQLASVIIGAA